MMRRTGFWGLVPLLLGPMCALAIEVGEIRVNSALNQLFDATIPLPNLTPEELDRFSVKVASPAMFSEFGLDRARVVDQLVFSLQYDAEGQVYVKMVSMQPIREPSLALLLEFGWPRGKTFREYTVLLDPVQRLARRGKERSKTVLDAGNEPGAVPETPKGVITVNTAIGKPSSEPLTVAGAPAAPVPAYRPGDQYGPVLPGEGLWGIALKLRPDPGITREQMMQALFKANPQAFSKAGISGLKGGSMLRIPTLREIAEFSGSAVAAQLAGMNAPAEATAAAASTAPAETTAATKPAAPAEATAATKPAAPAEPPAPTAPLLSETMPAAQSTGKGPDVFVLAPPTPLEPAPVAEAVKAPPVAEPPVAEAVKAPPVAEPPVAGAVKAPPVAEPPVAEAVKAPASESPADAAPVMAEMESAGLMEHISVTPLLFLAVSEVMMTAVQLPTPLASGPGHRFAESPPVLASAEPAPVAVSAAPVEPTPVAVSAAPVEPTPVAVSAAPVEPAPVAVPAAPAEPAPVAAAPVEPTPVAVPAAPVEPAPVAAAPVEPAPVAVPAAPAEPAPVAVPAAPAEPAPVAAAPQIPATEAGTVEAQSDGSVNAAPAAPPPVKPGTPAYSAGSNYGPISNNERLWDIAGKLRPDPAIGRDVMMKALFLANPQAFSKPSMDSLKIGATMRVPSLHEILELTGDRIVQQLVEQQQSATNPPTVPVSETATPESR